MKKAIIITFCFLSVFLGTSYAVEVTSFGPKQYLRNSGAPDVYTDTFNTTQGQGMLIVKNGAMDGENRISDAISSARVFVNGEEIFGPNDFNQNVYLLESPVNLADSNTISLELASNPGSYITIEVKQDILLPDVTMSANPETIQAGGASTLTWTSTNADSCIIEPNIGNVDTSGSLAVSPTETTTYTITATNLGGTATASITLSVTSPITLGITSPSDGETISRPDVRVQGMVANPAGNETGITVNGMVALLIGDQFIANHVPLQEGTTTITVTATDTSGNTATSSVNVTGITTVDYIRLRSDAESDISPFETTLRLDSSFTFTQDPSITYTGPGTVEFLDSSEDNEYKIRMTTEGVYHLTAEVRDVQDNIYTDTISIQVFDKAQLDVLLTAKWEEMRQALGQNDIENAVIHFHDFTKDAYREMFTLVPQDKLIQRAQELADIQFIKMVSGAVEYDIRTIRDGKEYSYYLLFVRDGNGLWKIRCF